jgi:aspartate/tyrosine/aromatic aminotransferase
MDSDAARAEVDAAWKAADEQISEVLKNPHIRERIETEFNQVRAQAAAVAEQAKQQAAAVVNNLAQEANLVANALFPELAGLTPDQVQGALRVMKPERVAQVREFANKIQGIANAQQQQVHAQLQQQQQVAESQQRQAAEAFQKFAEAEDAKALVNETPESVVQIRKTILADAKAAGISEKELYQAYNSIPAMRHSFVQGLLADGAKYRLAQRNITQAKSNPIPRVQRPGVASDGPSDNNEYASLERQFRGKDLSAKQAADLLIAHRARR